MINSFAQQVVDAAQKQKLQTSDPEHHKIIDSLMEETLQRHKNQILTQAKQHIEKPSIFDKLKSIDSKNNPINNVAKSDKNFNER